MLPTLDLASETCARCLGTGQMLPTLDLASETCAIGSVPEFGCWTRFGCPAATRLSGLVSWSVSVYLIGLLEAAGDGTVYQPKRGNLWFQI